MKKFGLRLTGRWKCYSLIFAFFIVFFKLHIFLICKFLTMTRRPFYKVLKFARTMHFFSLFFLNKRNITTSLLMLHLKCTVVHYDLFFFFFLAKLYQSLLLIINVVKRCTLRSKTISDNWKSLKNYEKCFFFHLRNSFPSEDIFVLIFWSCKKTTWLERQA